MESNQATSALFDANEPMKKSQNAEIKLPQLELFENDLRDYSRIVKSTNEAIAEVAKIATSQALFDALSNHLLSPTHITK